LLLLLLLHSSYNFVYFTMDYLFIYLFIYLLSQLLPNTVFQIMEENI